MPTIEVNHPTLKAWTSSSLWVYDPNTPFTNADLYKNLFITSGTAWNINKNYTIKQILTYDVGTADGVQDMARLDCSPFAGSTPNNNVASGYVGTPDGILYNLACDGDSQTDGYELAISYPSLLNDSLGSQWLHRNFGIVGQTAGQMLSAAPTRIDPHYNAGLYSKNVLVLWAGTNDLFAGSTAQQVIDTRIAYCQARRAVGWKVVLVGIMPRSQDGTPVGYEAARQTVNAYDRAHWPEYADEYVDIGANPFLGRVGAETSNDWFRGDFIHCNIAGYTLASNLIAPAVLSVVTDAVTVDYEALAAAVRDELSTELARIDVATSTRNATTPPSAATIASTVVGKSEFTSMSAKVTETELRFKDGEKQYADGTYERIRNGTPVGQRTFTTDSDGNRIVSDEVAP